MYSERLRLDEPNQRMVALTLDELKVICKKVAPAIRQADSGMKSTVATLQRTVQVDGSKGEEIVVSDAPVYIPRAAIFGKTSSSILGPVKPRLHVAARRADFRCPRSQRAR